MKQLTAYRSSLSLAALSMALSAAPLGFTLIAIEFLRQMMRPAITHDLTGL